MFCTHTCAWTENGCVRTHFRRHPSNATFRVSNWPVSNISNEFWWHQFNADKQVDRDESPPRLIYLLTYLPVQVIVMWHIYGSETWHTTTLDLFFFFLSMCISLRMNVNFLKNRPEKLILQAGSWFTLKTNACPVSPQRMASQLSMFDFNANLSDMDEG